MKNQIIAAGRELKPFFIPCVPGPRLQAPPWEHGAHPIPLYGPPSRRRLQLQFSTNRFWNRYGHKCQACLPSRGCHHCRPRWAGGALVDRANPSHLWPRHQPRHSGGVILQAFLPPLLCSCQQAPTHPAMPKSDGTISGEAFPDSPSLCSPELSSGFSFFLYF